MTEQQTQMSVQDFLEQLLSSGKNLIKDGTAQTETLTEKGKVLAAKGEDYLVDKLNLDDTTASRDALRKGVGAGAAAGALALLLTSRSGRKLATLGGLAGLGALAYKAHKSGTLPSTADEVIGLLSGPKADLRANKLLKAMVAAAKADGDIHDDEMALIKAQAGDGMTVLTAALNQTPNPKAIAALSDSAQTSREIYAVSCRTANGLNPKERDYLDALAMAMRLDPDEAAAIETAVRTG